VSITISTLESIAGPSTAGPSIAGPLIFLMLSFF
jgi:hypothetical protein